MIGMRDFHRIRVKTRDLKEVIAVYDSLEQKGFIEFRPTGIFSGYVDVICENYNLVVGLAIANISFSIKQQCSCYCVDANEVLGHTANHKIDDNGNLVCDLVTKEELDSTTASLNTGDSNKGINSNIKPIEVSDVNKIKLQRTKITERRLLNFKLEKRRTKWELIKALQEEFDKLPDETEFNSFSAIGIGIGRSRYL